jgi:predicted HTH domain antitoxin
MSVTFDPPAGVQKALERDVGDLARAAKEALAVELYRRQTIRVGFLAEMLGMGVVEAEQWLASRGVLMPLTVDDLRRELGS